MSGDSSDTVCAPAASEEVVPKPQSDNNEEELPAVDLLKWKDMPKHLQFNQYIVEGYRPLTNVKGCLHSLFYFHNETINIITHGKCLK